jgi:hypothetical protein
MPEMPEMPELCSRPMVVRMAIQLARVQEPGQVLPLESLVW